MKLQGRFDLTVWEKTDKKGGNVLSYEFFYSLSWCKVKRVLGVWQAIVIELYHSAKHLHMESKAMLPLHHLPTSWSCNLQPLLTLVSWGRPLSMAPVLVSILSWSKVMPTRSQQHILQLGPPHWRSSLLGQWVIYSSRTVQTRSQ